MHLVTDPLVAAAALAQGHLAVLPTETVYGLGARADDPAALARVYATKGRPADHPLIVHIADLDALHAWSADVPFYAARLAERFWPGPLTLVLPRSIRALDAVTGGQDTVALRLSEHPMFRAVLDALARDTGDDAIGIAAPSANRFGGVSPTTAQHVVDELGSLLQDRDVILDGGACGVGVESTIVDCTGDAPVILRPGAVSANDVREVTGLDLGTRSDVRAPGTLASHYAPTARVTIIAAADASDVQPPAGLLALASVPTPPGVVRLSAPETVDDYARVLSAALREADALHLPSVVAIAPSPEGIGAAVIDRLTRAAAGS